MGLFSRNEKSPLEKNLEGTGKFDAFDDANGEGRIRWKWEDSDRGRRAAANHEKWERKSVRRSSETDEE